MEKGTERVSISTCLTLIERQWKDSAKLAVLCLNLASRLKQVQNKGLHCCSCLFSLGPSAKRLSFLHTYFSKTLESRVSFSRVTAFKYSSGVRLSLCFSLSLCALALLSFFLIFSPSSFPSPCLFFSFLFHFFSRLQKVSTKIVPRTGHVCYEVWMSLDSVPGWLSWPRWAAPWF